MILDGWLVVLKPVEKRAGPSGGNLLGVTGYKKGNCIYLQKTLTEIESSRGALT